MTPEELHSRLGEGQKFVLVDTLPPDHFANVHLPDAQNACVYQMDFLDQVHVICPQSSEAIVVYGASSNSLDSRTAAEKLSMAGYSDVTILDGGIERWRQSGFQLAGQAPDSNEATVSERYLDDGAYTIISGQSQVGWTGRNPTSNHYGTVKISGGTLNINDSAIQGSLMVDMESIENINLAGNELQQVLISHLKSDDFFFIDAFPAARLEIHGGRFNQEAYPTLPNCELSGTLDLRGVQNDLNFKATLTKGIDGYLHLSAHFDMDRTLWGIIYGSSKYYEHLGMHTVFDHISIELQVVAQKQTE
jgi:rhodanese-related sulfurtransferase/polyisoprenoid-binding protein YceI